MPPRARNSPPEPVAPPQAPVVNVHPPLNPYVVFMDMEGVAHFMEFAGVHLYCVRGRHHVQDRMGKHYEVCGAYDIQDPEQALHSYQLLCAGAAAAAAAQSKKEL
ncbi:MAG: hypothetical protein BWY85_00154 [Firmicutes bacterium ADurb.Bin506]|nr:MAG: hypothetical protein BWY85_00154 [Firmicutes bacterium ADurb.Bin506]